LIVLILDVEAVVSESEYDDDEEEEEEEEEEDEVNTVIISFIFCRFLSY
jgi:hypothetical protein